MLIAYWQRVTHRLLAALDRELAGLDLSAPEINVLACLADTEQPTVRQLGDATGQRPSTLTGVLDRLERRKLVRRRPNPRDRRSTLIVLTAPGRDAGREVADAFERIAVRIPPNTAAEMQRLLSVLETTLTERPPRATGDLPLRRPRRARACICEAARMGCAAATPPEPGAARAPGGPQ